RFQRRRQTGQHHVHDQTHQGAQPERPQGSVLSVRRQLRRRKVPGAIFGRSRQRVL
ncbi:hypothetical protein pipiens_000687, partial [Culex pipiens pipiens]